MPLYRDETYTVENLRADLAALPLPGPALVIDVRANTTHALPLIWDVATELEDLTTELDLNQVPRWRSLAHCIDMLKISPLPPRMSLDAAPYFEIMTEEDKTQTVSKKQALVDLIYERVDRLRINRARAIRDRIGGRHAYEAVDPMHAAVRVFFLVDMMNETSLRSATSYADLLTQKDKEYDDPERTDRTRGLKTIAICINADPAYRKRRFAPEKVTKLNPRTVFDMLIFIQSYRDDNTPIRSEVLNDEMELILYTLLLVSPEQLDTDRFEEQDVTRHIMRIQGQKISPTPCPIYMLGIASTAYSGRWITRWINYGLVKKIIEILRDQSNVEQGKPLLQHDRKDWLEDWWSGLQAIAPTVLPALLPEAQVLDTFQKQLSANPFHAHSSLSSTLSTLNTYCQQFSKLYKQIEQVLQELVEEEPLPLVHTLQKILAEDGKAHAYSSNETYTHLINIYRQAQCFLVTLFQNAAGALPRAERQLSELATRLAEREHLAQLPDIAKYRQQFEVEAKRIQQQLKGSFQTKHSPLSPLWHFLSRYDKRRRQMREEALKKLHSLAQSHLTEVHDALVAQIGFTLLEQAGLYAPDGKISACREYVRKLDIALDNAHEQAAAQRKRADRRLHTIMSNEQVDMAQEAESQGLNSCREILPFQYVMHSYQELHSRFTARGSEHLNALGRSLLQHVGIHSSTYSSTQYTPEGHDNPGQLQMLGTELVVAMLSASATDYDLTNVQSLTNRYLDLPAESTRRQGALLESITTLQQIVKEAILEQTLRDQEDFALQVTPTYGFARKHYTSAEDILAAWIELQYVQDRHLRQVLSPISIMTRLKEQHRDFDHELEDLQRRSELLGYREQTQVIENDHFYLLFLPGPSGDELAQVLASTRTSHIERIHFPDREKLIYLHVHRIRSGLPDSYSSHDS